MHQRKSVIVAGGVSPTQSLYVRLLGVIRASRAAFDAIVQSPRSAAVLVVTFLATMLSTGMLLETETGRLALVDQWERTATAFGQAIDDQEYAAMEDASQNGLLYAAVSSLVSGPLLTIALAAYAPTQGQYACRAVDCTTTGRQPPSPRLGVRDRAHDRVKL